MKKILVTGAGGFVGARILEMWRGRFELSAFPPDFLRTADETAVRRFITAERPDVIVHTAALSNTQVCQQHPEESFRANVLLPEWVAAAAAETGAKLLSFSSDQVYAGGIPAVPCRSRDGYLIPKQKIICKCFSRFFESERHLQMILFFTKFRYAESLSPWERCHRLR